MSRPRAAARPARLRGFFTRRLGRRLRDPWPPVGGNSFTPMERGESYYERMLDAIGAARHTVDVEMYLWEDDAIGLRFVGALATAARRGARVRVLVDAQGAADVLGPLAAVGEAGGTVRVYNPFRLRWVARVVHRTHKKLLVVDGALAFVGGAGFSLHFAGPGKRRERPWHDRMYEVRGPVTAQLEELFETDFGRWGRERLPPAPGAAPHPPPAEEGGAVLRVLRGWPDARDFRPLLIQAVQQARERVWIGTPYFLPPRVVRRSLYRAAARGVDVRVVLPGAAHAHPMIYHAVRARYGRWIARGVKLHEYGESFYHAKTFVADRTLALVGSTNFDSWSWIRNAELDLAVTDAATVEQVASLLGADRAKSRQITREDARVRSFFQSVREGVAAWFEDWL